MVAKEKKVEELFEQLAREQQAAERDGEVLKLQHSRQVQELQERVDELNLESRTHGETMHVSSVSTQCCFLHRFSLCDLYLSIN